MSADSLNRGVPLVRELHCCKQLPNPSSYLISGSFWMY